MKVEMRMLSKNNGEIWNFSRSQTFGVKNNSSVMFLRQWFSERKLFTLLIR